MADKENVVQPVILVHLDTKPAGKEAAIREAAAMLAEAGCVDADYAESMLRREASVETYLDAGVAIPHGTLEDKVRVKKDGLAVLQIPGGIEWSPGHTARFVVGIAARGEGHLEILRRLADIIIDAPRLESLISTKDATVIIAALSGEAAGPAPASPAGLSGDPFAHLDLPEKTEWVLDYPTGLHARPAAHWVKAAKAGGIPMRIRSGEKTGDPRNVLSLLQLGLKNGDKLVISAEGANAAAVLADFLQVVQALSAQEKQDAAKAAQNAPAEPEGGSRMPTGWMPPAGLEKFQPVTGVPAGSGLAVGKVCRMEEQAVIVPDKPLPLAEGSALLQNALNRAKHQMAALVDDAARRLGKADAAIFQAQAALLEDNEIIALASRNMVAGHGAAFAWNMAIEELAGKLAAVDNPLLAARAADLRDVGRRVLFHIEPSLATGKKDLPEGDNVIVAKDLSPSDTAALDPSRVAGLVTSLGGPTSHTAILARTLGLAAVVACGDGVFQAKDGSTVIVDGDCGRVWLNPPEEAVASARAWIAEMEKKREAEAAERGLPAQTTDGARVEVSANINLPDQVPMALDMGAEGVGLMRTEFLFLERGDTPGEDEQYETYRAMAAALGKRPLIVRALDIGGDKQVAHLKLPHEDNPFLGVRGARLLLRRPDLMEPQLRALYRAARDAGNLSIMFPMITSLKEVLDLREVCDRIRAELNAPQIPLGIMIEVPAAAVMADMLSAHVDFFSIGTNDLTQYTLAMDRQSPELAPEADSLHPAVLRLIARTVEGADKNKRWVGVCGGIAGNVLGAALLTGLGVTELSMTPREVPAVKAMLRRSSKAGLEKLARRALGMESADQVRALASEIKAGF